MLDFVIISLFMRYFSLKAIYLKRLSVRLADNFEQINPAFVVIEHYRNINFAGSTLGSTRRTF